MMALIFDVKTKITNCVLAQENVKIFWVHLNSNLKIIGFVAYQKDDIKFV